MKKKLLMRLTCFAICFAMIISTAAVYADDAADTAGQTANQETAEVTEPAADETADISDISSKGTPADGFNEIVPVLTVTAGDAYAVLKWDAVEGAEYYQIGNGSDVIIDNVTDVQKKITGLNNGVKYSYSVRAMKADADGITPVCSAWSGIKTVTPSFKKPAQVTGVKYELSNKAVTLSWKAVSKATSYNVYRWSASKNKYVKIASTTKTSYKNTKLAVGKKYYYRITAVRKSGKMTLEGTRSAKVTIKAKAFATGKVHTMYFKARITKIAKLYKDPKGKKCVGVTTPGKNITVMTRNKMMAKVKFSNGKVYWVYKSKYVCTSSIYTSLDYTTKTKEAFVNGKKFKSKSKYLIWISQYTQRVNIFKKSNGKWKLIRNCRAATGSYNNKSAIGVYKITYKEKGWFYGSTYVKPVVHWCGSASFHSRIYYNNGALQDGRIGMPISHGCVRLYNEDINYIYKKMPVGTTVVSY